MNMKKLMTVIAFGAIVSACNIDDSHAGVNSSFENVRDVQKAVTESLPHSGINCPGIYEAVQNMSLAQKSTLIETWSADLEGTPAQRLVMLNVLKSCAIVGKWEPMQ